MDGNARINGNENRALTLKGWKQVKGFTWVWLCSVTGMSYPALMNWLREGKFVPVHAKVRISEALGLTPDQIADEPAPAADDSADGADDRRTFDRRAADRHVAPEGS